MTLSQSSTESFFRVRSTFIPALLTSTSMRLYSSMVRSMRLWACSGSETSACTAIASPPDRKSTRLNSSHANISYAVFCLKQNPLLRSALERGQHDLAALGHERHRHIQLVRAHVCTPVTPPSRLTCSALNTTAILHPRTAQ